MASSSAGSHRQGIEWALTGTLLWALGTLASILTASPSQPPFSILVHRVPSLCFYIYIQNAVGTSLHSSLVLGVLMERKKSLGNNFSSLQWIKASSFLLFVLDSGCHQVVPIHNLIQFLGLISWLHFMVCETEFISRYINIHMNNIFFHLNFSTF